MARNGVQDAQFLISVEPINDHPMILAPGSIFFGGTETLKGQIYEKSRDTFQFSIVEPDLHNVPGNKSDFSLVFSLEVFDGTLTLSLPASTIPTVEVKTEGANHWQPLQTYVIIANHFEFKGTAIRFRGMVQDCNNAMQQLHYQGPSHGTTLSITVNDLGNYGCYPDCSKMMGTPLSTAKTIRLVKRVKAKLKNPITDRMVGWLVVIEILTMLCLGVVLLFFLFKCIRALKVERRDRINDERRTPSPLHRGVSPSESEDVVHCSTPPSPSESEDVVHCSTPPAGVPSGANRSCFRQRSLRSRKQELELQPASGIRNNGNQDGIPVTYKDE